MSGITTDNLGRASGLVKAVTVAGGKTLGVTEYLNSTRAVITGATSALTILSSSYTQIQADSVLKIDAQIQGYPGGAAAGDWHFIYDGADTLNFMGHEYNASEVMHFTGLCLIDGASTTGSKDWSITWHTANSSSNRPFGVLNPNTTDSALQSQCSSRVIFHELDL